MRGGFADGASCKLEYPFVVLYIRAPVLLNTTQPYDRHHCPCSSIHTHMTHLNSDAGATWRARRCANTCRAPQKWHLPAWCIGNPMYRRRNWPFSLRLRGRRCAMRQ